MHPGMSRGGGAGIEGIGPKSGGGTGVADLEKKLQWLDFWPERWLPN
jgi:hypothetical protein